MLTPLRNAAGRLAAHEGFRRYFANTSWMFAEQILRLVAGLLVGIWVARYLGPAQFGIINYAGAFVGIFGGIAKLGLDGIVVRDLAHAPEKRDEYLGTAFWLKLAGALVMLALVALATRFTTNDRVTNLYIFIIAGGLIFQSFEVIDFYFQSRVLSKYVSLCKMTQLAVSSVIKLYLILTGAKLFWFVMIGLADQLSLTVSLIIAYRSQRNGNFYRHFHFSTAKRLLKDSWPVIFSSLAIMVYMRIDQVMIKAMLGEKAVGIYSAAVRLSEVWYFIPMIITSSLLPAIVSAKKVSEALYYLRMQRLYTFMLWTGIAIALPMTFLSYRIVGMLYGSAYADAGRVLRVLIWAGVNVFLGSAWSSWILCENKQIIATAGHLMGAALNVLFNLVFIPRYGILGAAYATLLSYSMSALFAYSLYKPGKSYGLFLRSILLREGFK